MLLVPQMPKKVQYLLNFSFPLVRKLTNKTALELFAGGRKGYDKEFLFGWLLIKKSDELGLPDHSFDGWSISSNLDSR